MKRRMRKHVEVEAAEADGNAHIRSMKPTMVKQTGVLLVQR